MIGILYCTVQILCFSWEPLGFESESLHCSFLFQILKQNNTRLENRTQLVTMCHMGPKVFINCAGFIKIDTASLGDRWVLGCIQCLTTERGVIRE